MAIQSAIKKMSKLLMKNEQKVRERMESGRANSNMETFTPVPIVMWAPDQIRGMGGSSFAAHLCRR